MKLKFHRSKLKDYLLVHADIVQHNPSRLGADSDDRTLTLFVMEPGTVVDVIVDQVLLGKSGQVILPSRFAIVTLLQGSLLGFRKPRVGALHMNVRRNRWP
jgi:hypothetical protein